MLAVIVAAVLAVWAPSRPEGPRSRPAAQAAEQALTHYEARRYDEARTAIARAYMIEPWPEYLYARAQIERSDGDCVAAREFYQLYLDADPSPSGAEMARAGIEECPVAVPAPTLVAPGKTDGAAKARAGRVDRLGVALAVTGGAGVLVGVGLYAAMAVNQRAAERADSVGSFGTRLDRARALSVAAAAVVSIGAVLAVAGAVRLAIVARRSRRTTRVGWAPSLGLGMRW